MNKPFLLLAAGTLLAPLSHAAVQVLAGGTTETFDAQPAAADWSTMSLGGASNTFTNEAGMDAAVNPLIAANITTQLAANANPQGTDALARWNSPAQALETAPTGNAGTVLMASLNNASGAAINGLRVSYSLGLANSTVATPELPVAGHRTYWSLTGLANSWTVAGNLGYRGAVAPNSPVTPQTQQFDIPATWDPGTPLFILWVDDNSEQNVDGLYSIDNVRFSEVPEPASAALGLGVGLGAWLRRRRK